MELGEAEALGVLDDHDGGIGDVHADFDDGGGDENLRFVFAETLHDFSFSSLERRPCKRPKLELGKNFARQALVLFHGGFQLELRFFDDGIDDVGLMAGGYFAAERFPNAGRTPHRHPHDHGGSIPRRLGISPARSSPAGHQAYVVYPVIEESKLELKSRRGRVRALSREVFPKLQLGLLHGRLSSDEKEEVMQRFRKNEAQILVATTVVEVGVDVPNATVMVIEHAERFGLSPAPSASRTHRPRRPEIPLHPRRPRPHGRRPLNGRQRRPRPRPPRTMVRTSNGFEIAETDLLLRGPGEFSAPANPATSASTSPIRCAIRNSSKLARREGLRPRRRQRAAGRPAAHPPPSPRGNGNAATISPVSANEFSSISPVR